MHKSTLSSFVRSVVAIFLLSTLFLFAPKQAFADTITDPSTCDIATDDEGNDVSQQCRACLSKPNAIGYIIESDTCQLTIADGTVITDPTQCYLSDNPSECNSCTVDPNANGYVVGEGCDWKDQEEKEEELEDEANAVAAYDFCRQVPDGPQRQACVACVGGSEHVQPGGRIYTALGCIQTSEDGLVADLVKLLLGVGGGVALLTILAAAFTFTTSQGDTGKVKEAKELMTAAVSGLLFTIFSVIILNFLGVTILKIPGLG